MNLLNLLLALLGFWTLLQYWILPHYKKKIPELVSYSDIPKITLVSVLSALCKILMYGTIATAITYLAVSIVNSMDGVDIQQVKNTVDSLASIKNTLSGWAKGIGIFTSLALILALIYTSYRFSKKSIEEKLDEEFNKEFNKLVLLKESGELEEIEPSDAMQNIEKEIAKYDSLLGELQNGTDEHDQISNVINELIKYYYYLDISRRIDVKVSTVEDDETPKWILFFRPFISEGMFKTTKTGAALLSMVLSLFLVPSFFSISAPVINESVDKRLVYMEGKLEELEVIANLEKAEQEWIGVVSSPQTQEEQTWSDEDQKIADALAAEFESNVIGTRFFGNTANSISRTALRTLARQKILNARAAVDNKATVISIDSKRSQAQLLANDLHLVSPENRVPQTEVGTKFSNDLKELGKTNSEKWKIVSAKAKDYFKSFGEVPAPRQLRGLLISNSLGNLSGALKVDNEIANLGTKLIKGIPKDIARNIYEAESKRFLAKMVTQPSIADAINDIGSVKNIPIQPARVAEFKNASHTVPNLQNLSDMWTEFPPSYQRAANDSVNLSKTSSNLKRYAAIVGRGAMQSSGTEFLASFDDYFPGYNGAEKNTPQAKEVSKYSNRRVSAYPKTHTSVKTARARSFIRLRGFSRIGGVLIGRPPMEESRIVSIDEIMWKELENNKIKLTLVTNTSELEVGTFDMDLVALALAYSADARPTTVTMVTASPLRELKILIHPTLEDTYLGCLATRLDQMVDETTSEISELNELRENINKTIKNQNDLYMYSWAIRASVLNEEALLTSDIHSYVDTMIKRYFEKTYSYVENVLNTDKSERDFMVSKPEFYDPELINNIETCINSSNIEEYTLCIKSKTDTAIALSNDISWTAPVPEYQPWSGVREREYTLNNIHDDLIYDSQSNDLPFEFTFQLSFTSPPYLIKSKSPWHDDNNVEINNYFDEKPWEFLSYKHKTNEAIKNKAKKSSEYKEILSKLSQFTILQRIFRLALNDNFGEDFKINNLIILSELTSKHIEHYDTKRWLSRPGQIENEFFLVASNFLSETIDEDTTASKLNSCRNLLAKYNDPIDISSIPVEEWNDSCLLEASYAGDSMSKFSQEVSLIREMRYNMGIVDEDLKWKNTMTCSI